MHWISVKFNEMEDTLNLLLTILVELKHRNKREFNSFKTLLSLVQLQDICFYETLFDLS